MAQESTTTTAIVGGGPAGAAAAHSLAIAGHDVLVIDKVAFPRDKFCGDGLTTLALRQLDDMGFDPGPVASWTPIDGAVIRSPRGRIHDIPLPRSGGLHAAVARRAEFDEALLVHATDAGARTRLGAAVVAVEPASEGITLRLADGGSVRARQCVAADGMWSPVRKLLGLDEDGYRGEWHAFRQYFVDVGPDGERLWVWFEPDVLPGYVWSFPVGPGVANVGFGILRGGHLTTRDMKGLWPDLLQRPHIASVLGADARPEAPHRAWPIPARIDRAALTGPRTLFVGDAAAACDPLTGEGIGQALLTGRLAADAILGSCTFDHAAERYRTETRHDLVADHRMAVALGRLLRSPRVAEAALRTVGTTDWTRRNFGRWMFEDYPRALVVTPSRWERGALTRPGAWSGPAVSDG